MLQSIILQEEKFPRFKQKGKDLGVAPDTIQYGDDLVRPLWKTMISFLIYLFI